MAMAEGSEFELRGNGHAGTALQVWVQSRNGDAEVGYGPNGEAAERDGDAQVGGGPGNTTFGKWTWSSVYTVLKILALHWQRCSIPQKGAPQI